MIGLRNAARMRASPLRERDQESLRAVQPNSIIKYVVFDTFNLSQQPVIDAPHGLSGHQRGTVYIGKRLRGAPVIVVRTGALELHEIAEGIIDDLRTEVGLAVAELGEVLLWKVNATTCCVLPQVPENVRELQCNAEVNRVLA